MQVEALIVPSENPPAVDDLKRALLTFDTVRVLSPDERGLVPDTLAVQAIAPFPFPIGINIRPLRPLGKIPGYDRNFEDLLDTVSPAVRQGLVLVDAPSPRRGLVIGSVPVPSDTPNPRAIYDIYRSIAADPIVLALINAEIPDVQLVASADELAPESIDATDLRLALDGVNGEPGDADRVRLALSLARVAAVVRSVAQAHLAGAVPLTADGGQGRLLKHMTTSLEIVSAESEVTSDGMLSLRRLSRLHNFLMEEQIDESSIHAMSVPEIIGLRTVAWGTAGEGREALNAALREIALNESSAEGFERAVGREIDVYRSVRSDLDHELSRFGVRVAAGSVATISTAGAASSIYHSLYGMGSLEAVLVITGLLAKGVQEYAPVVMELLRNDREIKQSAGYSILGPYRSLLR
jgi:hypothetical protein